MTIRAGKINSAPLHIYFENLTELEIDKAYLCPVSLNSAQGVGLLDWLNHLLVYSETLQRPSLPLLTYAIATSKFPDSMYPNGEQSLPAMLLI